MVSFPSYPAPMPDEWIRQLGDPVLRTPVRRATRHDGVLRGQVERMAATLDDAEGAGLAATQVGILQRAFVYRLTPAHPVRALIEPRIEARSCEQAEFVEGCLSFQSIVVRVIRPAAVRVSGYDLDGRACTIYAEGIEASLMQHEIDHLDGILTLDRAVPEERRRALGALAETDRALVGSAP
jgi:peptide deformylase